MDQSPTTHVQVLRANAGACQGLADGMQLEVEKETPAYFFLRTPCKDFGGVVKVSKQTGKGSRYRTHNAPTFNL